MALAPDLKRNRGIFGTQSSPTVAGGGMLGGPPPAMTATAEPQKKGFDWGKLIGVLGDSLSIAGGGQAQYVPNLIDQRNRQQAQAYAEQQYQRRRGDDMTDWQAKQEIEARNRPPTYFDDNAGNRWSIGADGKPALAFRDPTQKYTQQVVTDPDGSQRLVPVPIPNNVNPDGTFASGGLQGGGQSSGPPQAAIDALKGDPALRDQFNQKYGPGAAERYMGGASGNAGGNF